MGCPSPCPVLACAEQVLRAAAREAYDLAAAAHRKMHREAEKCGACADAVITLLQLFGGVTARPAPRTPNRTLQRRVGLRLHLYSLPETHDEHEFVWFATSGCLRRAAELARGCSVLQVHGADELTAAFALEVELRQAADALNLLAAVEGTRRPVFIEGSYWVEGIDLHGRGVVWLLWTDDEDRRFGRQIPAIEGTRSSGSGRHPAAES